MRRKKRRGICFKAQVNCPLKACQQQQLRSLSFTAFYKRLSSLRENNTTKTKSFTVLVSYLLFLSLVRFFFFQSGRPSKVAADDPKKWAQRPKILTVTLNAFFFVLRHEGEKEKFKSFRPHILIASIHKRAHSILNAPLFRIQHWYYSFFG